MSAAKSGERAGNFLVSDLGTAARAGNGQPAEPTAAKRGGVKRPSRGYAQPRRLRTRHTRSRFLLLTPSHFFPAVGNGGALSS